MTCNHQVAGAKPAGLHQLPWGRMFHRGELRSQRDWADASSVVSTNGPACSVEARIPGRDSEEGATPFRSTSFAREVLRDALLSSKQREPARYRPRAPYGADVQGDGLVSKTDRQGAIPWRRANLPPVAQRAEQAIDNRQRPVQVRTGGPFYSAAWTKAHTRQTISGVSVKRAADPFGGQADLVMARA